MIAFFRSSWGFIEAVPAHWITALAAVLLAAAFIADRYSWGNDRVKRDGGYTTLETVLAFLAFLVALVVVIWLVRALL